MCGLPLLRAFPIHLLYGLLSLTLKRPANRRERQPFHPPPFKHGHLAEPQKAIKMYKLRNASLSPAPFHPPPPPPTPRVARRCPGRKAGVGGRRRAGERPSRSPRKRASRAGGRSGRPGPRRVVRGDEAALLCVAEALRRDKGPLCSAEYNTPSGKV